MIIIRWATRYLGYAFKVLDEAADTNPDLYPWTLYSNKTVGDVVTLPTTTDGYTTVYSTI